MKSFIIITFSYIAFCCPLFAQTDIASSLSKLDSAIVERGQFEEQKIEALKVLTQMWKQPGLLPEQQYDLAMKLYNAYAAYKFDSAYYYSRLALELAHQLDDRELLAKAQIAQARGYCSAGLFKEAFETISRVDTIGLSDNTRADVIHARFGLTFELAVYSRKKEPAYSLYVNKLSDYLHELQSFLPADDWRIVHDQLDLYTCKDQNEEALGLELLRYSKPTEDLHDYAIKSVCLGRRYLALGDTVRGMHHIAEAAVADIENCTRETTATRILAETLYALGDIEHAYQYAREALTDAGFFDSRHREIEIANILPIIENQRFDTIQRQKNQLLFSFIVVSLLFLAFLIAVVIILKQVNRIKKARVIIENQNKELLAINSQLSEMSKIKDECIGQIFSINSAYLDKIDDFRKVVARKIQTRQYDDLQSMLKKSDLLKEREVMFVSFDDTFLKLFPDFVQKFNALFKEEDRIVLKSPVVLTTELRIFALIRLGITENERIAKFLNYSVNTVNTYKTRIKNRSVLPNERFEASIFEIASVCE